MARDLRCTGNNRQAYIRLSVAVQTYRMPRRPRNYLPGYTYHLVQRGVNRAATFFKNEDFLSYLTLWEYYSQKFSLRVHPYCLMTNPVHFFVTPPTADARTIKGLEVQHQIDLGRESCGCPCQKSNALRPL